jgi:site-specific DNA-cytosine methylase
VANAQAKAEISQDGKCPSLTCIHEAPYVLYENHANDSRVTQEDSTCQTVSAFWGTGGNNTPLVQQAYRKSRRAQSTDDFETWVDDGVANTVNCFDQGDIRTTHAVAMVNMQGSKSNAVAQADGPSYTLNAMHGHDVHAVAVQQPMAFSPQGGGDMRGVHPRPTAQPQRCQIEDVIQPIYSFKPGQSEAAGGTFVTDGYAPTLQAINNGSTAVPAVVFAQNQSGEVRTSGGVMGTLNTNANASVRSTPMIQQSMAVRRLTPVECERLQGFPDGWTDIRPKGKDTPDSPRYKALGNSMAVPVMRWIGERIQSVR